MKQLLLPVSPERLPIVNFCTRSAINKHNSVVGSFAYAVSALSGIRSAVVDALKEVLEERVHRRGSPGT